MLEVGELAHVRDADEEDDGDGGGVLGQTHADDAPEERFPGEGGREEDGEETGAKGADDAV